MESKSKINNYVGRIGGGSYSPTKKDVDSFDKVGFVFHHHGYSKLLSFNEFYDNLIQISSCEFLHQLGLINKGTSY